MLESKLSAKNVEFKCPKCGAKKEMLIPMNLLEKHSINLATVVVNGDCGHNYIAYLDRQLKVRSYQYTDLFFMSELEKIDQELSKIYSEEIPDEVREKKVDSRIFEEIDREKFLEKATEFYQVAHLFQKPFKEPIFLNKELIAELKSAHLEVLSESEPFTTPTSEAQTAVVEDGQCTEEKVKCEYMERLKKIEKYILDLEYEYVEGNIEAEVFLMKKTRLLQVEMKLENFYNHVITNEINKDMSSLVEGHS